MWHLGRTKKMAYSLGTKVDHVECNDMRDQFRGILQWALVWAVIWPWCNWWRTSLQDVAETDICLNVTVKSPFCCTWKCNKCTTVHPVVKTFILRKSTASVSLCFCAFIWRISKNPCIVVAADSTLAWRCARVRCGIRLCVHPCHMVTQLPGSNLVPKRGGAPCCFKNTSNNSQEPMMIMQWSCWPVFPQVLYIRTDIKGPAWLGLLVEGAIPRLTRHSFILMQNFASTYLGPSIE